MTDTSDGCINMETLNAFTIGFTIGFIVLLRLWYKSKQPVEKYFNPNVTLDIITIFILGICCGVIFGGSFSFIQNIFQ